MEELTPRQRAEEREKKHKATLLNVIANHYSQYDYGIVFELLEEIIDNWIEYYSIRDNVYGIDVPCEENDFKTRLDMAKELRQALNNYSNAPFGDERKYAEEFFTMLGKHIVWMWD